MASADLCSLDSFFENGIESEGEQMEIPKPEPIALGDELFYLRGKIITGYAQVEFLLADISVKLNVKFPYLIKDRIKEAKKIVERPGYEKYRDELFEICDRLVDYVDLRHFMAHGMVMITTMGPAHSLEMRRYERSGEGKFKQFFLFSDLDKLRGNAADVGEYSSRAVRLFQKIYLEQQLEK
jgi:hypothetical protein